MVARTGREFAVAQGAQLPAERLLGDREAEFLEDPLREIDQPPPHHAVDRWDRATLDHLGDHPALAVIELGGPARRLAIQKTLRPPRIEPQNPVPDDLERHPANLRRLGAGRPVVNGRQGQ